ncbi:HET-domain-containing protein [Xylaria castorea]|nr:HET-domain-containing protein [Xylaria castorea]
MRLIDVENLELKEFFNSVPPYAILSHTWGDEEVTFQEHLAVSGPDAKHHAHVARKAGYAKIVGVCKQAKIDGMQYLWCDTNCINKSSSAELSEAINSMYAWYRDSVVCYAYLADVDAGVQVWVGPSGSVDPVPFEKSRWFTRGWTLQELLAPKKVVFFDRMWKGLGDRKDLADRISKITRIHIGALYDRNTVPDYSTAQRMSWAADRQTSRQEDISYCLLGIFDVNMPLLYGEGHKAFVRLQQKIIKSTDDQSLFAWDLLHRHTYPWSGILAPSPASFLYSGSVVRNPEIGRLPFVRTNLGMSIKLPMIPTSLKGIVLAGLNCCCKVRGKNHVDVGDEFGKYPIRHFRTWIWLRIVDVDIYERTHAPTSTLFLDELFPDAIGRSLEQIFVSIAMADPQWRHFCPIPGPMIRQAASSAGFIVNIGFGILRSRMKTYKTAYLPGSISTTPLKRQGQDTVSHELVSSKTFSVLISAAWDQGGHVLKWKYTSFKDPQLKLSSQMMLQKEWACVSDKDEEGNFTDRGDSCAEMYQVHHQLECGLKQEYRASSSEAAPFVAMEPREFWDLEGQQRVIVRIVFQEATKEESIYEIKRI